LKLVRAHAAPTSAAREEEAVKKMIVDWYAAFARDTPEAEYRKVLTDDYVLLENGELSDGHEPR
jgi:hypothetical protein